MSSRTCEVGPTVVEFLAEFTQHIPPKGAHLVRYYGWYSNKARGMRRKAAEAQQAATSPPAVAAPASPPARCSQTWAMLIKRIYEADPLTCQKCGGRMEVVAFIEPPQQDVIEKILRHCGLWQASSPRPPPGEDSPVRVPDDDGNAQAACCGGRRELTLVPDPSQTLPGDEPWEVTRDACGELFDAAF